MQNKKHMAIAALVGCAVTLISIPNAIAQDKQNSSPTLISLGDSSTPRIISHAAVHTFKEEVSSQAAGAGHSQIKTARPGEATSQPMTAGAVAKSQAQPMSFEEAKRYFAKERAAFKARAASQRKRVTLNETIWSAPEIALPW